MRDNHSAVTDSSLVPSPSFPQGLAPAAAAAAPAAAVRVGVCATFTADPITPALAFWLRGLFGDVAVEHAPFNQVFQHLLDPASLVRRADAGLVLVRLSDWHQPRLAAALETPPPPADSDGLALASTRLPNGLEVRHLNPYETEYVYREIFVDRCYLRHGISLEPGDVVVDIGANIGLFSLFVQAHAPGARVFAFEPAPAAFAALTANVARLGGAVTPLWCGAGDHDGEATFTAYTHSSVFSSFAPDAVEDSSAIRTVIRNVIAGEAATSADADRLADELVAHRLDGRTVTVPVRTLSGVIVEHGLDRIDLLKIDAEKSELAVLRGLAPEHWARVRQVVIEVHDRTGALVDEVRALLTSQGFDVAFEEETLLRGSGLYNLYAVRPEARRQTSAPDSSSLSRAADDLAAAITAAAASGRPLTLLLCPPPPDAPAATDIDALEARLAESLAHVPGVSVVTSQSWTSEYPVDDLFDAEADRLGSIPYSAEAFAAMATAAARRLWAARTPRPKVLVVDADQTLWSGVVGEDGVTGVVFDDGRLALHRFLLAQRATGVLLAVCSRNEPEDVRAVLASRHDTLLRWDHLSAHAIGWGAKSDGLRAIARDLGLGLDSLVFLDDNPIECAEVRSHCAGVVTYQVPADSRELPRMLRHLWPLDSRRVTAEDRQRADLYAVERARRDARTAAGSYAAFIAGLELDVAIAPCDETSIARAAQLTERTNQFNSTTERRSEAELRADVASGLDVRVVRVRDRFGDYGLVGVVATRPARDTLVVEWLLLSCRVLGKGVEHRVLADVGRRALALGLTAVTVHFTPSARNQPARRFLESLPARTPASSAAAPFAWTAADAAATVFTPPVSAEGEWADADAPAGGAEERAPAYGTAGDVLARIPHELATAAQVASAARQTRGRLVAPPRTPLEATLAGIWSACLRVDAVGVDDVFQDLGGDSIHAVQVASRGRAAGLVISPRDVLETTSLADLASRLEHRGTAPVGAPAPSGFAPSAPRPIEFALTPLQALFHAQYVAGLDAGFEQFTFRLTGPLDTERLRAAWNAAIARHEALRTSFHETPGGVVQRVAPDGRLAMTVLDWRAEDAASHGSAFAALVERDRGQRFDLTQAPLARLTLARVADDAWHALFSFHHLVVDGWSWPIVLQDVAAAYGGATLAPAPAYSSYVAWLAARDHGPSHAHWQRTLAGRAPERGRLVTGVPSAVAVHRSHVLTADATAALATLARTTRSTLGALVAAAWGQVVADATGRDEAVIGLALSGRPADLDQAAQTVGTFVTNVPVRVPLAPGTGVRTWLGGVAQTLLDTADHQFLPPAELHEAAATAAHQRPFESLLVVQNYAGAETLGPLVLGHGDAAVRLDELAMPVRSGYPVTVAVIPGPRLTITIDARPGTGREADVDRWLAAFVATLEAMPGLVDATIDRLRVRSAAGDAAVVSAAPRVTGGRPVTPLEQTIAAAWADVFGHHDFGADDNFFALGGHSLQMLRVQTRLAEALGRPLSIVELFQHPTIRALAARLTAGDEPSRLDSAQARAARQRHAFGGRSPRPRG